MRKYLVLLLGFAVLTMSAIAQSRTITGKVTGPDGVPILGASVTVKGSNSGTSTDQQGNFSLSVPAAAKAIVISSVGFADQEVSLTGKDAFVISLKTKTEDLEEVVVVAYGTTKKEALTGSVSTINAKQLERRPLTNATCALEGNVPGLITTSANGQPGSGVAIRVRGFGSLSASSDPLYVIDGVPYIGGTSNLNPDDIESISVLKDASSTSL